MKIVNIIIFYLLLSYSSAHSDENFNFWLKKFSNRAIENGISIETVNSVLMNAKFLPNVIKYDRYQPEFYEDTNTYINKRANKKRVQQGIKLYNKHKTFINKIENEFSVEKELLLSLMAIETNYGKYVGKMDIISSLATLSFDKRRSEFFSKELLTALKLIDMDLIDEKKLYGSWAGAFGYFQFMPSTIDNYAIDYDVNNVIELKTIKDSFASAANYINKIGWKQNEPCFKRITLEDNIPIKYLNTSAKKIRHKRKLKFFKKFIKNYKDIDINENYKTAIITPDMDIVENANKLMPAYLVFNNYELVLKWNRSLRFGLAVCTLKRSIYNEL